MHSTVCIPASSPAGTVSAAAAAAATAAVGELGEFDMVAVDSNLIPASVEIVMA